MDAILILIIFVIVYRIWESKKEDRMSSNERFKHELDKIK